MSRDAAEFGIVTSRYAVFYAPSPDSALWAFGSGLIGYDAESGASLPCPEGLPCPPAEWRALTEEPRRYGFHGTLKAPFSLAGGSADSDLVTAARDFASGRSAFDLPGLDVVTIGAFTALAPTSRSNALEDLAADSVRAFEPFRAPLSAADRERRLRAPLSGRQIGHLDRWGYPYVFDEFRFHMTLTGPLPDRLREPVRASLQQRYAALRPGLRVDAVAIFRQPDRAGPFRVLARLPFGGPPVSYISPGRPPPAAS
ncbi:DUF1045 domain-containing protein [uncultured Enterovirga sp.]|uniref:DUF1045 domain-containing protein n=1 Tax=uncultured Enterovirga sp. TaxID=2026352 RepID=UPI0035CBCF7C